MALRDNEYLQQIARALRGTAGSPSSTSVQTIQGFGYHSEVTNTRPANTTPYTTGDVVGGASSGILTFTNVGAAGGHIFITDTQLRIDLSAVPSGMGSFRLHLYDASPTAIADNAVWDLPSADRTAYIGYVDLGTPVDVGSTLVVQAVGINKKVKLATASTSLYGIMVTTGAYTPTSAEVSNIRLHTVGI